MVCSTIHQMATIGVKIWLLVILTVVLVVEATTVANNMYIKPLPCPDVCHCVPKASKHGIVCTDHNLTTIPAVNASTHFVDFTGNHLTTLTNQTLTPVHTARISLEILLLKACAIHTIENGAFDQLENLQIIDLSNNGLTVLKSGVFSQLSLLIELNLAHNNITTISSDWFGQNAPLRTLNMSFNPIEFLDAEVFVCLAALEVLTLRYCALHNIHSSAFDGLFKLRSLDLSHNQLHTLTPDLMTWFQDLKTLELHSNPWHCDCNLQAITIVLLMRKFTTLPASLNCTVGASNVSIRWTDVNTTHPDCMSRMQLHMRKTVMSNSHNRGKTLPIQVTNSSRFIGPSPLFSSQDSSVTTIFVWCAVILLAAVTSYVGVLVTSRVCVCATTKAAAAAAHAVTNVARKKSSIVRRESSECERALVDETARFRDHFYLVDEASSDISVSLEV